MTVTVPVSHFPVQCTNGVAKENPVLCGCYWPLTEFLCNAANVSVYITAECGYKYNIQTHTHLLSLFLLDS